LAHRKAITPKRHGAIGAENVNPRILSRWFANPGQAVESDRDPTFRIDH
jgi:hypothetical protein